MHTHTYNIIGLTTSLDNLLTTTTQPKLSERSAIPISQTEETKPSEPITSQKSMSNVSAAPDSTVSHGQVSKDDSPHISDSTHHLGSVNTAACDSGQEMNQNNIMLCSDASTKDSAHENSQLMHDPITNVCDNIAISEPAYKTMIRCRDKLVTALSTDILSISGVLVANEFVPAEVSSKMLLPTLTPQEKATILVIAITEKIKLAPDRFQELIKIFSEQTCTKDVITHLSSHISCEQITEDRRPDIGPGVVISNNQQYAIREGHMYTAWRSLDPDDKIDLEARLLNEAETIGQEFALLCWKARDSFEQRGITPQTLASALLDLTVFKDPSASSCYIPLLKEKEEILMNAQSVHEIFHTLRPHMSFFNYEILQFLIEGKGSEGDKVALATYLRNFKEFCKRHVFEVPFTSYSNGHQVESHKMKQRLHIKVTKHFKAAFLITSTAEALPSTNDDESQPKNICSSKLAINLEDAKNIQRKFANILDINPSSLFLDSIKEGSVILTFMLPACVSLAGLDNNREIAVLSSNGVTILCGPPGKPEMKELAPNSVTMRWSKPKYGGNSLAYYQFYYQAKCELETSEWKKLELSSLETHVCVPNLNNGDTYVFKICTVSDVGTLQYSDESDPIVLYNSEISVKDIYTVISSWYEMITLALSLGDLSRIATKLLEKEIISEEQRAEITLASQSNEKARILSATVHKTVISKPEKFREFLNILSSTDHELQHLWSQVDSTVETLWSMFKHDIVTVCSQYAGYLKFLYTNLNSKQTSSDQWPPSATHKFFRLAMIKAGTVKRGHIDDDFLRMTITGKVDDILRQKYPVKLKDIFLKTPGERKVVLLEGAPGCGKSTLSVYICQQWEKGEIFNQFKLVILIRLRDPAVKNAKELADLLPCPDTTTAQQIAARMLANKCQDVLFVLDGWDELPPDLRNNSIFLQLVQPKLPESNPLCESTVIVTSRPIASGDLHQIISSRVEILGFTAEELHQFFTECLKGDAEAVKTLLERIEENPEVAGSCYLPLNATILVHLFKSDCNTLPTTLYGIFSSLVLICIKRHLTLRTQHKDVLIQSLDQLPQFAKKPFLVLCQLAYDGVMEDKIVFTSLPPDVSTLSLLQGVESFIGREKATSHNFIHLSIQELLAAWYIATQLPASEQMSKFNELFNKSRFSAIFRFYAAITKLKKPGIVDIIIDIVEEYNLKIQVYSTRKEGRVLMVSLLHCLYEAQDPSLCESVAQQLQHGLDLQDTILTPSDCLCIGYFLAHVCKMTADEFGVNLIDCSIDDQSCKYLVSGLHKSLDTYHAVTTLFAIRVNKNNISYHGVHHLSLLLKIGCINLLNLSGIDLGSKPEAMHTFDTLTEQLKNNTTLKVLWLVKCGLNSQSTLSLAEALIANKHLEVLSISNNALCDDGIQHLAHALRVNQGLKELHLDSCGMTDVGLECLAKSLQHNNVLTILYTYTYNLDENPNEITEKIIPVFTKYLQNNHTLTELELPSNLKSSTNSIEKAVNDVRKRSELPLIEVSGMSMLLNENNMHVTL